MSEHAGLEQRRAEYDAVLSRDGQSVALEVQIRVAAALVGKGRQLAKLGRPGEAFECLGRVVATFGDATDAELGSRLPERWPTRRMRSSSSDVAMRPTPR